MESDESRKQSDDGGRSWAAVSDGKALRGLRALMSQGGLIERITLT